MIVELRKIRMFLADFELLMEEVIEQAQSINLRYLLLQVEYNKLLNEYNLLKLLNVRQNSNIEEASLGVSEISTGHNDKDS